jgi:hypothetical protein
MVWQDTWFAKMGLSNFNAMERSWDRPSKICSVLYSGRGRNKLFDFIILMCCLINSNLFYSSLIFALLVPFNMFSPSLMCMHLCYFGCKFLVSSFILWLKPIVKHKTKLIMNLKHTEVTRHRRGRVLMPTP